MDNDTCELKHEQIRKDLDTHERRLNDHADRIKSLEVKEAVLGSKLDTTNKLLMAIFTLLAGSLVTLVFDIIKRGGLH